MKKIIFILVLVLFSSCKEYLDIKPYGKTIPKTAEEFSAMLHSTLNDIDYGQDRIIVGSVPSIADFDLYSDNLEASLTQYPEGTTLPLYVGATLNNKTSDYERLYAKIRDCNIIINELKETDTDLGKNVMGTAYALRGICYYQLLRQFCDAYNADNATQLGVPLVRTFDMEARPARSPYSETVAAIESDFKASMSYHVKEKIYRFTEDVMAGYLARLYFWTEKWDLAADYASQVLTKYPLVDREAYKDMMQSVYAPKGSVIFKSNIYSSPSSEQANNVLYSTIIYRPVSKSFVDLFVEKESDVRYEMDFNVKRKTTKKAIAGMRSAEMCLIRAESYYHLGQPEKSLADLNLLRSQRIKNYNLLTMNKLPSVNTGALIKQDALGKPLTPLLDAILSERRKELFLEGDRWFELKRNGKPSFWVAKNGLKYTTLSYMYTYPIPVVDTDLVNGLIQNEGYEAVINN